MRGEVIDELPWLTDRFDSHLTLSTSATGAEAIVTVFGKVFALRVASGRVPSIQEVVSHEAVAGVLREFGSTAAADVAWEPEPEIWCDAPLDGARRFRDPAELAGLIARGPQHAYAVSVERPAFLLRSLTRPPAGAHVTPVLCYGGSVLVGPTFAGRAWPCPVCWRRRLEANVPSLRARVRGDHRVIGAASPHTALILARALWEAPSPAHSPYSVLDIDTVRGTVTSEAVLPFPDCVCTDPNERDPFASGTLTGRWVAPVHAAAPVASPVEGFVAVDTRAVGQPSIGGVGCDFEQARAHARAVGECLERRSTVFGGSPAAAHECKGEDLLQPVRSYTPYSDAQYRTPGFPYRRLNPNSTYLTLPGVRLSDEVPVRVPAQLCTLRRLPAEPKIASRSSTGTALAFDPMTARRRALLELAERDLVTRHWFLGEALEITQPHAWLPRRSPNGLAAWTVRAAVIEPSLTLSPTAIVYLAPDQKSPGALGSAGGLSLDAALEHAFRDALVMYRHRCERGALLDVGEVWPRLTALPDSAWMATGSLAGLVERYDPVAVDLSTTETVAVGASVTAVWSATAADFPRRGEPLQLGLAPHLRTFEANGGYVYAFAAADNAPTASE